MWVWQWYCHGNLWEVIPSRRYPERDSYQPTCPSCKRHPKRHWVKIAESPSR